MDGHGCGVSSSLITLNYRIIPPAAAWRINRRQDRSMLSCLNLRSYHRDAEAEIKTQQTRQHFSSPPFELWSQIPVISWQEWNTLKYSDQPCHIQSLFSSQFALQQVILSMSLCLNAWSCCHDIRWLDICSWTGVPNKLGWVSFCQHENLRKVLEVLILAPFGLPSQQPQLFKFSVVL